LLLWTLLLDEVIAREGRRQQLSDDRIYMDRQGACRYLESTTALPARCSFAVLFVQFHDEDIRSSHAL
jgi:hypothetical protein